MHLKVGTRKILFLENLNFSLTVGKPSHVKLVSYVLSACLRLFLLSNILLFRYQIILILKIIASYYEKFTPDCFVNLNV